MKANRIRIAAVAAVLLVGLFGGPIVKAATTFPGSITLTAPVARSFNSGTVQVLWSWRSGTSVKSTSTVDLEFTQNGLFWFPIRMAAPIRWGGAQWVTSTPTLALPDGTYALRVTVRGTSIKSTLGPIIVDNTPPEVEITSPAPTDVAVDDVNVGETALGSSPRIVVGIKTLAADATDSISGIASVAWRLDTACDVEDGVDLATGNPAQYDFSAAIAAGTIDPGQHQLYACVTDGAGNVGTDMVDVIILPGPSITNGSPSVPDPTQTLPPVPDPAPCTVDPASCLPAAPEVPDPTQSLPPLPEPPTAPDPTACTVDPAACLPAPPQ
jgi:hypothetical protein